ncbi:MAG: DUF465 domain-containing protein [Candidatus Nitronauta litoralis]|uniref:DUF465 domain-containing protein n=1 Tax=Candidatus Nitronauta litoralis TaxID=2705533 RepID=A0A7T0BXR7_9BACT|nr:MAG: DUF465 domain-containing protein [Candidatus Nitronauta litoralis]
MEIELGLLEKIKGENLEFKELYEEHTKLKNRVEELNGMKFLSPEQEVEKKTIQKQKLKTKDRLGEILEQYQSNLH